MPSRGELAACYWPILELVAAMPEGHEFETADFADTTEERQRLGLTWTQNQLFRPLLWGPLQKRKNGRLCRVWTRGPAPMPHDPTALLGAWCAANPTRRTFGAADLASLVQPRFRPGMARWLDAHYKASDGKRGPKGADGSCFTWHLDEQPLKVALGL